MQVKLTNFKRILRKSEQFTTHTNTHPHTHTRMHAHNTPTYTNKTKAGYTLQVCPKNKLFIKPFRYTPRRKVFHVYRYSLGLSNKTFPWHTNNSHAFCIGEVGGRTTRREQASKQTQAYLFRTSPTGNPRRANPINELQKLMCNQPLSITSSVEEPNQLPIGRPVLETA